MMYYSNTTASNHGFPIRSQTVTYSVERSNSLAETIAEVLKELKALQESSLGRIRLQYAYSEAEQWFYVVGYIADYDMIAADTLQNLQFQVEEILFPFGWEVNLGVIHSSTVFDTSIRLTDVI